MSLVALKSRTVFDLYLSDLCCLIGVSIGALGQVPSIDPNDSGAARKDLRAGCSGA